MKSKVDTSGYTVKSNKKQYMWNPLTSAILFLEVIFSINVIVPVPVCFNITCFLVCFLFVLKVSYVVCLFVNCHLLIKNDQPLSPWKHWNEHHRTVRHCSFHIAQQTPPKISGCSRCIQWHHPATQEISAKAATSHREDLYCQIFLAGRKNKMIPSASGPQVSAQG